MDNMLKRFFKSSIITSLILLGLGLLLIFQAEATIKSISYIIGGILVAIGILAIIRFIRNNSKTTTESLDIVYGTVTVILGILIITNPEAIASILPFVIGIGIIINGATKLQYALELKAHNNNLWKTTMIVAIISTIFGLVLIFNPFKGAIALTRLIGIIITIYSILDIISTISIKRNVTAIQKSIENTIVDAEIVEEKPTEPKKDKASSKEKTKKDKKPKKSKKGDEPKKDE